MIYYLSTVKWRNVFQIAFQVLRLKVFWKAGSRAISGISIHFIIKSPQHCVKRHQRSNRGRGEYTFLMTVRGNLGGGDICSRSSPWYSRFGTRGRDGTEGGNFTPYSPFCLGSNVPLNENINLSTYIWYTLHLVLLCKPTAMKVYWVFIGALRWAHLNGNFASFCVHVEMVLKLDF